MQFNLCPVGLMAREYWTGRVVHDSRPEWQACPTYSDLRTLAPGQVTRVPVPWLKLPRGEYRVHAWAEAFGTNSVYVRVK